MYLERPKSPSFTQSVEDTNTFLAAMSLWKTHTVTPVYHEVSKLIKKQQLKNK